MAKVPILDLNTLIERPTIKVDGKVYELLSPDELSILDSQRLTRWGREIEVLATDEEKSDELDALVSQAARKVLADMPDKVFAKLSASHRFSVVEVFTGLLLRRRLVTAGALAMEMVRPSTGAKNSRVSSTSSAAIQAGGSQPPRQPS